MGCGIGVTLSQMQIGNDLRQRGQSAASSAALRTSWEAFEVMSDITRLYAPPRPASTDAAELLGGRRHDGGRTGSAPQPINQEVDHGCGVEREDLRDEQPADDGDAERPAQLGAGA